MLDTSFRIVLTLKPDEKLISKEAKSLPWYELWGTVRLTIGRTNVRKIEGAHFEDEYRIGEYVVAFCQNLLTSLLDLVYGREETYVAFNDSANIIKIHMVSKEELLLHFSYGVVHTKEPIQTKISLDEYYTEVMRVVDDLIKQVSDVNPILRENEYIVWLRVVQRLINGIRERQRVEGRLASGKSEEL